MGAILSVIKSHSLGIVNSFSTAESNKRKREDEVFSSSKKKRLETTLKFVYQSCFIEGNGSDITINVLGRPWRLHKTYLQQSPYFASMFSGNWSEKDQTEIDITITDPNIDIESIKTVFGSCYCCELQVNPSTVVGVLAAATLFQLDGVIELCTESLVENICPLTFVQYYEAAVSYGIQKVQDEVVLWLANNLIQYCSQNLEHLAAIPSNLMIKVLAHPDLCVIQTETILYLVLRMWIYMNIESKWSEHVNVQNSCEKYFRRYRRDECPSFLERPEGNKYVKPVLQLKVSCLLDHPHDLAMIFEDNILPTSCLHAAMFKHWSSFLKIACGFDMGPESVPDGYFTSNSIRLGRVIASEYIDPWKWNLFNCGIDLVWTIKKSIIYIQRVKGGIVEPSSANTYRKMISRVTVFKLNESRQIESKVSSSMKTVTLLKHHEVKLLDFSSVATGFPLYLTVNLLLTSPDVSRDGQPT